jgi:hypothetical protein
MSTQIVTPEVLEQDPTMPVAVAPAADVIEAPVVPVAPPAPVEQKYTYQPKDAEGRPIGGLQVIKYTTQEELIAKLTHNHEESIRGMREVRRKQRLGITDNEALPDGLDKIAAPIQFTEKQLTVEERFDIAKQLTDPEKFTEARDRLFESSLGVKPEVLRNTLNQTQLQTAQLVARQNAQIWIESHPEFYPCPENVTTICEWMVKSGLQPTTRNFEYAQVKMEEAGLLLPSPIVREVPPVSPEPVEVAPKLQEPAVELTRISEVPVPQSSVAAPVAAPEKRQSHVPSSLNNRIASNVGAMTQTAMAALTLADIDKMPSDVYRKALADPAFVQRANELLSAVPSRPRR